MGYPMKGDAVKALLALEDGTLFLGRSFTGQGESVGEVVFNTSMSGYQEILTDPSYCGQMVVMTYPLVGNYGINDQDVESERIQVRAFLVKEYQDLPSNWRSQKPLAQYLVEASVPGVEGIDTRALTKHIREKGAMPKRTDIKRILIIGSGPIVGPHRDRPGLRVRLLGNPGL
jgi:carbamoyl-phosphate synthase small subunit